MSGFNSFVAKDTLIELFLESVPEEKKLHRPSFECHSLNLLSKDQLNSTKIGASRKSILPRLTSLHL